MCGEQAKDILHNNQFSDNIDSIENSSLFTRNIWSGFHFAAKEEDREKAVNTYIFSSLMMIFIHI